MRSFFSFFLYAQTVPMPLRPLLPEPAAADRSVMFGLTTKGVRFRTVDV
jgi:hypothetical protein